MVIVTLTGCRSAYAEQNMAPRECPTSSISVVMYRRMHEVKR